VPKIEDGPWPAFPADLTSIAVAVATQAWGTVLVFEKMFENRLFFVDKLVSMGARIIVCDPHRVVVSGPSRLFGQRLTSPDIRAGMAMLIAALCANGRSVIGNAACEPHVQDLCRFLVSLGAQIEGIESNVLRIHGVDKLKGGEWAIAPEHIEVGSFIGLAAVTDSDLTIDAVVPHDMVSILTAFSRLGIEVELGDNWLRVPPHQELVIQNDLGDQVPKIEDGPWPAFPADLTSIAVAVATQAWGTVLVFEKMFENRLFFVDKLVSMVALIIVCDPHRVVVSGPSRLYGQRLTSPDIRAGMAILIAALCATGRSVIGNVAEIDRGYERIDDRLRAVGAQIERVDA